MWHWFGRGTLVIGKNTQHRQLLLQENLLGCFIWIDFLAKWCNHTNLSFVIYLPFWFLIPFSQDPIIFITNLKYLWSQHRVPFGDLCTSLLFFFLFSLLYIVKGWSNNLLFHPSSSTCRTRKCSLNQEFGNIFKLRHCYCFVRSELLIYYKNDAIKRIFSLEHFEKVVHWFPIIIMLIVGRGLGYILEGYFLDETIL